jgi:SOS-response transcriptional repressor LexA
MPRKLTPAAKNNWAAMVRKVREQARLDQTGFGRKFHSSAMAVSRWERGVQEPPAHVYIELGNLAGDPDCWYFWGRAGLHSEDLMRVMPQLQRRLRSISTNNPGGMVSAGSGRKKNSEAQSQLVVLPLLKVTAATHGEKGDPAPLFQTAPVESRIAAPKDWCPNPEHTSCLRVKGNSMAPLINDGFVLAVDALQRDPAKLDGKIVIAWNKDKGLIVSRMRHFDGTTVLQPENPQYEAITLNKHNRWKVLARVLWWIGKAP